MHTRTHVCVQFYLGLQESELVLRYNLPLASFNPTRVNLNGLLVIVIIMVFKRRSRGSEVSQEGHPGTHTISNFGGPAASTPSFHMNSLSLYLWYYFQSLFSYTCWVLA